MTRAEYLQARANLQLVARLVREMPLADYLATIDAAVKAGAQDPKMWVEGHAQLVVDRTLASALLALQKAIA